MFEKNPFDNILKQAEKFNKLIGDSADMKTLVSLSASLTKNIMGSQNQMALLQRRANELRGTLSRITLGKVGISENDYNRAQTYIDQKNELAKVQEHLSIQQAEIDRRLADKLAAVQQAASRVVGTTALKNNAEDEARIINEQMDSPRDLAKAQQFVAAQMQNLDTQIGVEKSLAKQTFWADQLNKHFGGLYDKVKGIMMLFLTNPILLAIAAIVYLIAKAIKYVQKGFKETIDLGYDASQRMTQMAKAARVVVAGAGRLAILDPAEVMKSADALQSRLGKLTIPDDLILKSAELTRQIGLSVDDAAALLEFFVRIRGEGAEAAATSAVIVKATALANDANPRKVMADVANNAANFAKSGKASAASMGLAAINVARLGTTLTTISSIADRIVTDFEGTLEAQATIGAFAPGFDMTGLLVASQFGTDDDIARELKASVDSLGVDFDQMPRSMKSAIAGGLGVSVEELGKIASGDLTNLTPDGKMMETAQANLLNEVQHGIANPMDTLNRSVGAILSLLFKWSGLGSRTEELNAASREELEKAAAGKASMFGFNWMDRVSGKTAEATAILHKQMADENLAKVQSTPQATGYEEALKAAQQEQQSAQAALNEFYQNQNRDQKQELQDAWISSIKMVAGRPIEVTTKINEREIAKTLVQPSITRSSGQF